MQLKSLIMPVAAVCALAVAMPLLAHHSVSAEFDVNQPIEFEGVVKQVDLAQPAYLHAHRCHLRGRYRADLSCRRRRAEFPVPERLAERYAGCRGARDG